MGTYGSSGEQLLVIERPVADVSSAFDLTVLDFELGASPPWRPRSTPGLRRFSSYVSVPSAASRMKAVADHTECASLALQGTLATRSTSAGSGQRTHGAQMLAAVSEFRAC